VAAWRTRPGWHFEPLDLLLAVFLAPQYLSFWPSPVDWKLAARSWPWLVLGALALAAWLWRAQLPGLLPAL